MLACGGWLFHQQRTLKTVGTDPGNHQLPSRQDDRSDREPDDPMREVPPIVPMRITSEGAVRLRPMTIRFKMVSSTETIRPARSALADAVLTLERTVGPP
jgi:hypothetical protein